MNYLIAGLGVEIPDLGDLAKRCESYVSDRHADIVIDPELLLPNIWKGLSSEENYYLESGFQFYHQLIHFNGFMLHSSAVEVDGRAYLFSGPSGIGKSTHASMYLKTFPQAVIINDDKPALRLINGVWEAFGTPWCGKDKINCNTSAPVAGLCFLHRGDRAIHKSASLRAVPLILRETVMRNNREETILLMSLIDDFLGKVPVFEFYNNADPGDAEFTYRAMRK